MFGIHTHILASTNSYERAESYFNDRACRRSEDKDYHGVSLNPSRHVDHYRLHKRGESYALRYHYTDVVVYHPDGSVTTDLTYGSQNTARFANNYLPYGLDARFYKGRVMLTVWGDKTYAFRGPVTLRNQGGDWRIIEQDRNKIIKFAVPRVNRKVANAAWRDPRVVALREYLKTIAGLGVVPRGVWEAMNGDATMCSDTLLSQAINDEQHWPALAARLMRTRYYAQTGEYGAALPDDWEKTLRDWVYRLADAYYMAPLPEGTTHSRMECLAA